MMMMSGRYALWIPLERWARERLHRDARTTRLYRSRQGGMLVEGFDQMGTMITIYNYPYYPSNWPAVAIPRRWIG